MNKANTFMVSSLTGATNKPPLQLDFFLFFFSSEAAANDCRELSQRTKWPLQLRIASKFSVATVFNCAQPSIIWHFGFNCHLPLGGEWRVRDMMNGITKKCDSALNPRSSPSRLATFILISTPHVFYELDHIYLLRNSNIRWCDDIPCPAALLYFWHCVQRTRIII